VTDANRTEQRKEEWEALISEDSIPTNISKLFFGLGFACTGCIGSRSGPVPNVIETIADLIDLVFGVFDHDEFMAAVACGWVVIGPTFMPRLDWLIATGALCGLLMCLIGLGAVCNVAADSMRRHL